MKVRFALLYGAHTLPWRKKSQYRGSRRIQISGGVDKGVWTDVRQSYSECNYKRQNSRGSITNFNMGGINYSRCAKDGWGK